MKNFKIIHCLYAVGFVLGIGSFFLTTAADETSTNKQKIETISTSPSTQANLFTQSEQRPVRTFQRLAGSTEKGEIITNQDQSISCILKSWQLIGIFKDNTLVKTQGELVFEITNNSSKSQKFVLPEILVLNEQGEALTFTNPHRELQGDFIKFEPPIKKGETREFIRKTPYRSGWHEIELKTCRWMEKGSEYHEIYPELKDN